MLKINENDVYTRLFQVFWLFVCSCKCRTLANDDAVGNVTNNSSINDIVQNNISYFAFEKVNQSFVDNVESATLLSSNSSLSHFLKNSSYSNDALSNVSHDDVVNTQEIEPNYFSWRLEYTIIVAVTGGLLCILVISALICWKRHSRIVHPPQRSVYSVQDGTWDSLSLHYIDNPAEFAKESWDELSDDSYVASLDQAIARRMAPVTYYRNHHAALANGPIGFRHSTSSTAPIVPPSNTDPSV